jgi:hypothetical protein
MLSAGEILALKKKNPVMTIVKGSNRFNCMVSIP